LECDIKETENNYKIHAELPGVKKEDIKLDLKNGVLTLSGERREEKKEENEKYHKVERFRGSFTRSFRLPEGVPEKDINAKYENGVLEVCFPKPKQPEAKRIPIRSSL